MNCSKCGVELDGFKNKLYRNEYCITCYNQLQYVGAFKKQVVTHCVDCGVDLQLMPSRLKTQCNPCYQKALSINRKKPRTCAGCGQPNTTKMKFCKLCRKAAAGNFIFNIPPTQVTKKGVRIPKSLKLQVMMLLVKYKHHMISPIDVYITLDLYSTIFGYDAQLDSYPIESQLAYMIRVMKNLILQS